MQNQIFVFKKVLQNAIIKSLTGSLLTHLALTICILMFICVCIYKLLTVLLTALQITGWSKCLESSSYIFSGN